MRIIDIWATTSIINLAFILFFDIKYGPIKINWGLFLVFFAIGFGPVWTLGILLWKGINYGSNSKRGPN